MIEKLYDFVVLFSRKDIPLSEKIHNLWAYYRVILTHRIKPHQTEFVFRHHVIRSLSFSDLRVILREVFILGDYNITLNNSAPVIFDCGANIGITTLYFKQKYPDAHITAFEPAEKTFEILKKNVAVVDNVTCVRGALGKQDGGTVTFWEMEGKPGGSTSIQEVHKNKSSRRNFIQVDVPATKLSSHISVPVDLMKMDIEGGEGIVLSELAESGKLTQIKEMVFEYHYSRTNQHNRLHDIIELLEKNGYSIIIFGTDLSSSSDQLKKKDAYHFMIRAYLNT